MVAWERGRPRYAHAKEELLKSDLIAGLITDRRDSWGDVYEERLKLWNEFNLLWEALLQRQLENTETMIRLNRPPPSPQSILDKPILMKMGDELVRWCDGIEQHGLVDYEMGVAEEQILSSESNHSRSQEFVTWSRR